MMKHIICALIVLLTLGCSQDKETPKEKWGKDTSVVITGKIANYNPEEWVREGVYVLPNFMEGNRPEFNFPIDSLGNYTLKFDVDRPTDIYLYNGQGMYLLVHPGDRYTTAFDATQKKAAEYFKSAKIEGDHALANTQFLNYQIEVLPDHDTYRNKITSESSATFRMYTDSVNATKDKVLNRYIGDSDTETSLRNWLKAEKIVSSKSQILSYEMMYRMFLQKNAEVAPDFYDGIEPIGHVTEELLINNHLAYDFAQEYLAYIREIVGKKHPNTTSSWKEFYPFFTKEILERNKENRLFAQLMMSNWANKGFEQLNLEYYESISPIIDSVFGDSPMGTQLKTRYAAIKEAIENPALPEKTEILAFDTSDPAKYLDEIIVNAKGKVVFVDNWATWCGPCKGEFKYSTPKLKKQFSDDVEFVYLCYQSDEKTWKPSIAQYKVEGKHYFIENDNANPLMQQLGVNGFPTYTLINKKGEIVKSGFEYRPSEAITTEILNELIAE